MRDEFVQLLREICNEAHLKMTTFSHDWIIKIMGDHSNEANIYGYNFDINGSASQQICCDKNATWLCLAHAGVPCVTHEAFMNPADPLVFDFVPPEGSLSKVLDFAKNYDYKVVVKPLKGTGGIHVFRCESVKQIEASVYKVWSRDYGVAVSPLLDVYEEIRVIVLLDQPRLVYRKRRAVVVGDGDSTVEGLLRKEIALCEGSVKHLATALSTLALKVLKSVPSPGEEFSVEWRHNLGLGAKAEIVDDSDAETLAVATAKALNMKFCSVDVVRLNDRSLLVLEVNSGVMMDSFLVSSTEYRLIAKQIYSDVISHSLG